MKSKQYSLLFLVLITPFLTELLCSNIPAHRFFTPLIFIFLLIAYGLPVLAIREISIRWNLGLAGLFMLGLAYGIYNEGICAKTLLLSQNVPVDCFDGYSFLGVNFAWSAMILPWHATHSVLYPIFLTYFFFPKDRNVCWLNKPALMIISMIFLSFGCLLSLTHKSVKMHPYLLVFLAAIAILVFLSGFLPRKSIPNKGKCRWSWRLWGMGYLFYVSCFAGTAILATKRVSEIVLWIFVLFMFFVFGRLLKRQDAFNIRSLTLFALGDYCAVSSFSFLSGLTKSSIEIVVTGIFFIALFVSAGFILRRQL